LAWIGPLGYVCVCPYSVPTLLLSWFDDHVRTAQLYKNPLGAHPPSIPSVSCFEICAQSFSLFLPNKQN
jgi:hypothetical protein